MFLIFILIFLPLQGFNQTPEKVFFSKHDPYEMYLNDGDSTQLHYYQILPKGTIQNVLVLLPGAYEKTEQVLNATQLPLLAVNDGYLVIVPSLNWGTITSSFETDYLDTIFRQVIKKHRLHQQSWIIGGFSKGGMVAVTYAEKAKRNSGGTAIVPAAIIAVDPPLDLSHLWRNARKDIDRNFSEAAVNEGKWIQKDLIKELGGAPEQYHDNYLRYSPFTYNEKDGGNAKFLADVPLIIYTEPDIQWQMKNRHRDYYDLNATDISALINLLQQSGNKYAVMITTHEKGYRPDGSRHPHSWSIMDAQQVLNWLNDEKKKKKTGKER